MLKNALAHGGATDVAVADEKYLNFPCHYLINPFKS
jgi:hypothetical protein